MSTLLPSHVFVTATDFGPAVNVINWFLIVVSVLVVGTRLSIKYKVSTLGVDDVLILFALVSLTFSRRARVLTCH